MIKKTTQLLLVGIFTLIYCSISGQQINTLSFENAVYICPNASGQALVTVSRSATYPSYVYEYGSEGNWVCCFAQNQTSYTLELPCTGTVTELRRKYDNNGTIVYESFGSYYSPAQPNIGTSITDAACNTANGSIIVTDLSSNFAGMPRIFNLYNSSGTLISSTPLSQNTCTFSGLNGGNYKVQIVSPCSSVFAEKTLTLGSILTANITGSNSICKGTGAQLTASGGGTYQWNNGAIASTITVLPTNAGTYTYTVTVTNGSCSAVKSHTLIVSASPSAIITGPSAACKNSSFSLSASGGGTYSWSTGQNTASISVTGIQSTQNYSVTVTGSNGCQSTASQQVGVLAAPTLDGPSNVCSGSPANLVVTGGATYSWSTGETTSSIVAFPTGSSQYSVTVTDANNCIYVLNKTLSVENPPSANINGANTICSGQSTTLSVFGGASYAWSTGASTANITVNPLQNTTYTVTVSSYSGCSAIGSKVVTVKPLPNGSISGASSICPGQSTSISASGGGTYAWSTGASTATVVVSPTQNTTYTVSISNAQGCTVVLNHPVSAGLTGTASNDGPLTCTKTSVTLQGNSSATGATYQWKNASGTTISNTSVATVSTAGIYTLVISAPGGCSYTTTTPVVSDVSTPTTLASNNGPITCALSNVTLSASPSTTGQTYQWKNSTGTVLGTTASTSVSQAGTYTLVVTGSNGCSSSSSTTLNADLAVPAVSVSNDGPLTCSKTSVALTASSSNPNLQYTWRNSSSAIIASNATVTVTTVGTYTVEARGANGCTTTSSASITQSGSFPNISVNNPGTISCISSTATISGNSTTPGVSYAWYNPNGRLMSTQKSFIANIAGTYTLKVTSVEGCVSSANTTLGEYVFANQATTLNVGGTYTNSSFAQGELTCTNNSITMSASARFAGYSISVYWTDAAGTVLSTTSQLTVSSPGYYYLKQNDCPLVKEILIKVNRPTPVVQIGGEQLVCSGKNTTFTASGGSQYSWNTGATTASIVTGNIYSPTTYTVTVSTGAYCSNVASVTVGNHPNPVINITGPTSICLGEPTTLTASGGQSYKWSGSNATTESIIVYPTVASTYTVTVSSDKGCMASKSHIISTIKSLPVDFTLANVPTTAFCGEALVNLSVLNPNSNYTWKWSTGETTTAIQKTLLNSQTIAITATRSNGCTKSRSVSIEVIPLPQMQITGEAIACYGSSTTLTASSSSTYLWSTGATTQSITVSPLTTTTYTVTLTNAPNCSATAQKTVVVPTALSLTAQIQNDQDCIANNVQVVANATGGQGALRYQLDNGAFQSLPTFLNVSNGLHTLGVQDGLGCSASANVTIAELSPLQLPDPVVQAVNCFGESNGRISLSPTGGTAPYQYTWSNGNSTAVNQNLRAGTYTVTVTDANGCTANRSISVSEPTDIGLNLSITASPTCYGGSDGVLQSIVEGGSPAYTYAWSNGGTTAAISNLPANAYALTVTDAHGCLATASITTTQPTPVSVSYIISNDLDCIQNNVIITTNASGGRGNYSYRLDGGTLQSSGVFNDKTTGAYTLIVQDGAGCNSLPTSININEALPLSLSYSLQNDQDCIADNVTILPNATGGLGNKTFKIARYAELYFSENLSGLGSGKYTLVVEDSLKCTASQEIEIKETPVGIQALNLQGINDCVAGNTKIEVVTTGNRLPLVYRLNGQVVNGPVLNIPRIAGDYRIEVADAAGCVAFQERYIPAYDSVWVNEANLSPVSDCSIPNGGIHLVIEGNSATDYSSSVDGGATWHLGNWVGNLGPGTYTTAVRNELNGCVVQGPSVEVTAPGCFPIVGFIKDTILVTDLKQIIRLPWDIQTPPVFDKSFSLNIGLEGDGFPHLFDRPDLQNINLPELRSGNGFPRNYYYASGQQGFFYDSLFLNDSAFLYQYPESYLFKLQNAVGSEIKIDPKRDKLRVIVMLGDPDIFTEDPILICSGSCITIGEDLGPEYCYSWTEFPNESKGKIEVCPQKDAVYNLKIIRNSDFSIVKSLAYNVKVADPKIIVKADPAEICKGKETTLSWQFAPGQELLAENNWEAYWSNGMQGNSIKVSPDQTSTFTVTITSGESACGTITQDITVKVNESPGIKEILPKNPIICLSGATSSVNLVVPGQGNFSYAWSNGASTSSISVATPGTFSVSITNEKNCTTSLSTQVRNSDPQSLKQFFDGGNFFHMPVEIKTTALTPSPVLRNSDVDNRTSLGEINMRYLAYGSIFSLAGEAGSAMSGAVFGDFSSKKVYITDNTSLCLFPNTFEEIQAELKNNDLAYWIHLNKEDDNTQADYYITCSSFDKNQNAPVSAEHKGFISNRLQHVAGKIGLNGPQTLQLTMNSLIDNFVESYGDLNAQFGGTETSNPVSVDPETNCASTNKPTNVVTPAGVVFKVPEKSQIRFNIIEKYKNSAPDGALSGFTNVERDIFGGRAAPKGQTGQSINGNYFKGYENLSSRGEGYYPYTPLVDVSQPVEIWLGVAGYDPSKKIWTNTLRNQKLIDGQTNSEGSGIITKNVIGAISPPSKNLSQTYDISTAGNPPSNFAGWNVATGIKHVDRQYTDENTSHFIINIPRANGQEPISIFVDRFRRKFYVFNCANGLWTESLNINGYINDLLLTDAFYKVVDVVVKLATDGHFVLDVVGMIPVIGSAADIINGVWYYIEGDAINGTLSFVGAIPGIGELAIVGKFVAIAGTTAYVLANGKKITKFVQRIFKAGSGVDFVMDWIKYADDLRARGISDDVADSILRHLQNPAFQATDEGLALIKKFSDNPELLVNSIKTAEEAFKEGSLLTKDIDVIISISKILDDPTKLALFNRLEGGGFASFLKDYNFAGCKTCLSSTGTQLGYAAMPFLDEILENTIWAMEHFQETTGFWSLMKREADGGNLWSKDGIQHMLRDMKNQGYENVLEFEQVLAGSTKKFDVRLLGGKLVEYKSYLDPAKIDAVQLLAYFDNIPGWSSLEYVFNKSKILSAGLSDLDVYKKFRTIMENNAPAMWSKNQNLLKNLFLKNGDKVKDLVDFEAYLKGLKDATEVKDFSGALFSFIKIR